MSDEPFIDRAAERLGGDLGLVIAFFVGIYALYIAFGLLLGYGANGTANALRRITFLAAVYALAVLALNLHWGYTGLFNIGVAGFMAVGVYTMAMVSAAPVPGAAAGSFQGGLGLPLWVGILAGMAAAGLFGAVASLPALRLRADYLAIVTIGLSEIARFTYQSTTFQPWTGGGSGFTLDSTPASVVADLSPNVAVGGVSAPVVNGWFYAIFLLVMVGVFYWFLARVANSPFGRVLAGIREDEEATQSLGKHTPKFKMKSFVVGCAFMGLVGILWQGSRGFINPTTFKPQVTFFIWIAIIIGGAGSNTGSVLGGALFAGLLFEGPRYVANVLSEFLALPSSPDTILQAFGGPGVFLSYFMNNVGPIRLILTGVVLVVLMHRRPDGLLGHRQEPAAAVNILGDRGDESRSTTTGEALATDATDDDATEGNGGESK
ncbi:branched-chain amino acid ABC transporter permease [Halocalculus aciditolerans]|uniref:Branched-chain amino acid ABC transporter permease n=1 Tax=Halocalculus aciditolerans TaxID=1383812 RepID=A0A830F9R1_9EURY|nr:branched-chain amino acid ABC transporter permease [Halocalculus aciditolerans]GGL53920.1 branched-chain amino acid ABC transporter permease [Halocalculus aciditolerans]